MKIQEDNILIWNKIFIISVIIVFILLIIYCFMIIPPQIKFLDKCKSMCKEINMTYETTFFSYPTNVNGKCYCINKLEVKIK